MTDWSRNLDEAPHNTQVIVQNHKCRDVLAEFDPSWGGGRGAWFDRRGRVVAGVWCWRGDVDAYLADRLKGWGVVPAL